MNELSAICRFLIKRLAFGTPPTFEPVPLSHEATWCKWTADLAENLAQNNLNVRDAIRIHDQILEQQIWPDPGYMASADADELLTTIFDWLKLNVGVFNAMLAMYPLVDVKPSEHAKCATIHDAFNELAQSAWWFIDKINHTDDYKKQKILLVEPPGPPPDNSVPDGSVLYSLARIEAAMHRFVQGHMQIATFIPAHLRFTNVYVTVRPLFK